LPKISVGDKAPDFSLHSQSDEEVRLGDYLGKKNVVLYFYPKDFTPGCTAEAKGFRDSYQAFSDVESHRRFSQECSLPFKLLSDSGKRLRELYGVSSTLGLAGRVTFVIDKQGIVRLVYSSQLRPTKHIREALDALKTAKEAPKTT
jgi:peroxiredoxin Q/BCP